MSIDVAKLRALQRQAGRNTPVVRVEPQAIPGVPATRVLEPTLPDIAALHPGYEAVRSLPSVRGGEGGLLHRDTSNTRAASPSTPTSIQNLRRLLGLRDVHAPVRARTPVDRSLPGIELEPGLRLIETHQPFACPAQALPLAFAKRDASIDPRDLLFFDTETTGLAGGTGTRAFMVGAADWHVHPQHGDGLRVRQLLITTLAAEPAMLRTFATWLAPSTVLSSYNGRCYDSPLLRTRYRLARMSDALADLDHVDLLFPTRRRYRGTWENCRLATIERELLKIVREDDLPGAQAPAAWLTYLRGGASTLLNRVCAHNHQDVVTLARLLLRLVDAHAAG